MSRVSIIIPTLNEGTILESTLYQLSVLNPPVSEVIVVDGCSEDGTVEIAHRSAELFKQAVTVQVLSCVERRRSTQMNYGAKAATGDIICLLHADTWVPNDFVSVIEQTLAEPAIAKRGSAVPIACGGFISLMVGSQTTRWGISLHNYLKTYYAPLLFKPHLFFKGLRLLFGDQVMFCRRRDFWDCGGFDEALPIMEDGDLCLRLFKKGRIYLVNRIVQSSDRRVARWGSWKATAIYLYIGLLWGVGVKATYLQKFYQDIR